MTATDGFILRNTPILGRTAVTHHLFEIHLNVFIPPVSFPSQAPSAAKVLPESMLPNTNTRSAGDGKQQGSPGFTLKYSTCALHPFPFPSAKIASHTGDLGLVVHGAGRRNEEQCWVSRSTPPKARQNAGVISSCPLSQHSSFVSNITSCFQPRFGAGRRGIRAETEPAEIVTAVLQNTANMRTPLRLDTCGRNIH